MNRIGRGLINPGNAGQLEIRKRIQAGREYFKESLVGYKEAATHEHPLHSEGVLSFAYIGDKNYMTYLRYLDLESIVLPKHEVIAEITGEITGEKLQRYVTQESREGLDRYIEMGQQSVLKYLGLRNALGTMSLVEPGLFDENGNPILIDENGKPTFFDERLRFLTVVSHNGHNVIAVYADMQLSNLDLYVVIHSTDGSPRKLVLHYPNPREVFSEFISYDIPHPSPDIVIRRLAGMLESSIGAKGLEATLAEQKKYLGPHSSKPIETHAA